MPKFKVTVELHAADIMQAQIAKQGVQNVLNELAEHQGFLIELSDAQVAHSYKQKIMSIINNPIVKALASKMK